MKKNLIIALAVTGTFAACKKENATTNPVNEVLAGKSYSDKEWKIKSIKTTPAVIDVDGDGRADEEIITSLQTGERNKSLTFASDGKVWEKSGEFNYKLGRDEIKQNGNWNVTANDDQVTWIQDDGTVVEMQVIASNNHELKVSYGDEQLKIAMLLEN